MIKYLVVFMLFLGCNSQKKQPKNEELVVEVSSLQELIEISSKDSVLVKMKAGIYKYEDTMLGQNLMLKKYDIEGNPKSDYPVTALVNFSGNHSKYFLDGVIIHIDTKIYQAYGKNHIFEIFVSGNNNEISGLKVENIGEEVPIKGAIMMHVMGNNNTISKADLFINGSYPYGYGHLLGKAPNAIVKPRKHSSLLVSGKNTKLIDCKVVTHSFGHGIVMQGAYNTLIKNCYVEGQMRETNAMLSETFGPAFDVNFKSDYPPGKILPNEIKALSEDGVRSYPYGYLVGRKTEHITVENTTVKNMRSGFDLSAHQPPTKIIGCTALGCQEKGYSVSKNAVIKDSKGDAQYGPIISFHKNNTKNCNVELELINTTGQYPVKRLAEINGTGHKITIKNFQNKNRSIITPIVFGESFWSDVHRYRSPNKKHEAFSGAYNITLINETGMPVVFEKLTSDCNVISNGELLTDLGNNNKYEKL